MNFQNLLVGLNCELIPQKIVISHWTICARVGLNLMVRYFSGYEVFIPSVFNLQSIRAHCNYYNTFCTVTMHQTCNTSHCTCPFPDDNLKVKIIKSEIPSKN